MYWKKEQWEKSPLKSNVSNVGNSLSKIGTKKYTKFYEHDSERLQPNKLQSNSSSSKQLTFSIGVRFSMWKPSVWILFVRVDYDENCINFLHCKGQ